MNIIDALIERKSTRAFLNKAVEHDKLKNVLQAARHAPSGTNAQPWQVAVVTGKRKTELTDKLEKEFRENGIGTMDYQYYPLKWKEPYKKRRVACGAQLYSTLKIDRKDRAGRLEQWIANYRAFEAPAILFFFMDPDMQKGSYLDYGMFIQSVMLAALAEGLATCPQAALGQYPELVKSSLGYDQQTILLCGVAIGYEDKNDPVNNYRTPREEVDVFTKFYD